MWIETINGGLVEVEDGKVFLGLVNSVIEKDVGREVCFFTSNIPGENMLKMEIGPHADQVHIDKSNVYSSRTRCYFCSQVKMKNEKTGEYYCPACDFNERLSHLD